MPTIKNKPIPPSEALSAAIGAPRPALDLRAKEVSLKEDQLRDYSITLQNIDEAIIFHINNTIRPFVIENDSRVPVPVVYANPERWKSAQLDGSIRDKEGQVMFPVIVLKKDNIEKNQDLGNKLDGNKIHNYNIIEERYTKKNQYDNFSTLANRKPAKSYRLIPIPDYYTITYTCSVYVNDTEDLNIILESIMYASRSYWGDPNRFRFMVNIQGTPITQELNEGENRKIYSEFTLTVNGHVIPNSINQFMSTEKKFFSKSQVIFTMSTGKSSSKPPKHKTMPMPTYLEQFFGNVLTFPTDSGPIRFLEESNFSNVDTFTSRVTSTRYLLAVPAVKTLVSVITANNEDIVDFFIISTTVTTVNDDSGTPIPYKVYQFKSGIPLNLNILIKLTGNAGV